MQDPREKLQAALKDAMKNKDTQRRDVLRLLQSAIKQVEIDTRKELSADEVIDVLQKEAKKRRESIADYEKAGRADMAEAEHTELAVIEEFLPRQLTQAEITAIVREVIAEVGAESPQDISKVMGPVMARVKGVADGKLVNQIVRQELA
ncbi:MAG: aspartyl-tRNA amidotransferase [Phototrophicales bacterium]|nr:MAG: aspartyl-tRNA amidotransferase [Phototrophicales bacterium]RMG75972.1 MAG: GatB/YqeY domain-containing protein [Chloroflexota bacterium]